MGAYGRTPGQPPAKRHSGDPSSDEDGIGECSGHLTHFESGQDGAGRPSQRGGSALSEVSSQARGTAPLVIRESLRGTMSGRMRAG